jgi:hypothetical protein
MRIAFCVAGWYFYRTLYESLVTIPDVDVFVVSHRDGEVPPDVGVLFDKARLLSRPNLGYDWGCYQQFLETNIWRGYDYIVFLHDDVIIHDPGFVGACGDLLERGHKVIGNHRPVAKTNWPQTHAECYAHSTWKPPSRNFCHGTVRGSFFATTRSVLEKIGFFEVFWDRFGLNLGFGNWSLVSTCGKLYDAFGENAFGFLSDITPERAFITEMKRGGTGTRELPPNRWLSILIEHYKRLSSTYTGLCLRERPALWSAVTIRLLKPLVFLIAGR